MVSFFEPDKAVFALSPSDPGSEVNMAQVSAESENYKVGLIWPEQILPQQPVTFGIRITDKSDTPVSAAAYELVLCISDDIDNIFWTIWLSAIAI
jgi:hypothetical protein